MSCPGKGWSHPSLDVFKERLDVDRLGNLCGLFQPKQILTVTSLSQRSLWNRELSRVTLPTAADVSLLLAQLQARVRGRARPAGGAGAVGEARPARPLLPVLIGWTGSGANPIGRAGSARGADWPGGPGGRGRAVAAAGPRCSLGRGGAALAPLRRCLRRAQAQEEVRAACPGHAPGPGEGGGPRSQASPSTAPSALSALPSPSASGREGPQPGWECQGAGLAHHGAGLGTAGVPQGLPPDAAALICTE